MSVDWLSLRSVRQGAAGIAVVAVLASAPSACAADERLERLERRVGRITELTVQIDALRRENRELRGQIELQQNAIETLQRKQRDLYQDVDQRLSQLQGSGLSNAGLEAGPKTDANATLAGAASAARSDRPVSSVADPARERAEYQAAYDLLRPEQRRYDEAIQAFRAFLDKYPNGKLAANAQYWLAEASYVTQDNAIAKAEFQKVVDQFPDSSKVPGALLKIGYLQHANGEVDAARRTLTKVIDEYANTSAASMARQRLQRIDREAR